jgi:uncharacterized repeat protein (TIGR03803 family)
MSRPRSLGLFSPEFGRGGDSKGKPSLSRAACLVSVFCVAVFCVAVAISSPAQTFTTLMTFNNTDGANPEGILVEGLDGNFYGTTSGGGSNKCPDGCGTVFKFNAEGKFITLHFFDGLDGGIPTAGLLQATNGNFYGITLYGGDLTCYLPYGCGTIFEITPAGKLKTLHIFTGADGEWPMGGLIQATDGNFYGTTSAGGNSTNCSPGCGTVFRITAGGALTTLHNFDGADGWSPTARLLQARNGNFYGTAIAGGNLACDPDFGCGTIFEINSEGTLTEFYTFCPTNNCMLDGAFPSAGLLQASDGKVYGTTDGQAFSGYGFGTVYQISANGTLDTLHSFCSAPGPDCPDGFSPQGDLVQATDGNLYGIAGGGTPYSDGAVFEITPEGVLTTLHSFEGSDGANPSAGLIQATSGIFYGTTYTSTPVTTTYCGCGTVFSLSVGLGPFVKTLPSSGNPGLGVRVLGTDLTGATSVTFNGKAAAFRVVSPAEITTVVPVGATTGGVEVITPSGTLSSNVVFRVP